MIDSHAHLNSEQYSDDLEDVLGRAKQAGVKRIINVGFDMPSSVQGVQFSQKYENCYAAVGIHPHDAKDYDQEAAQELTALAREDKVLAIGETGLDYYYDHSPRDVQQQVFKEHLSLAEVLSLPVVIHSRDAAQDTLRILQASLRTSGVLHCYSGSAEMAKIYVEMGCYFSFGGPVTFKNADRLRETVKGIPVDRVMLETDCPYLAPVPHRGTRNEPANLVVIAEKLSEVYGLPFLDFVALTEENTRRFFRMP